MRFPHSLPVLAALFVPAAFGGEVTLNGRSFTLPEGYTLEKVAGPPLVDRPIVADFDEQGRLYVADSSGTNDKVEVQLAEKPHRIVRLEDTNGDGVYDRRTIFADKMMFPEGTMWLDGSLYVAAPPSIWKLTDTDNDGVADRREEWYQGKTLTGCANDLHGPYRGPDGWVYWCKGAFAKQTHERVGKPPFETRAAHIFRSRPDGTGLEPVMTGGMDNPVDVVFTEGGERLFTTTFIQSPRDGKRDAVIHAVYGGIYGKQNNVLNDHPWTSPELMPVMVQFGAAAPAGLAIHESPGFGHVGDEDVVFACQFNMAKVSRHVLKPSGGTFAVTTDDLLVSADRDFHPTDVLEDADGSLLVVDTGGWYKLCCPTSQLPKPDILGGIYRVRAKNALRVEDARGLALDWAAPTDTELRNRLADPRFAVRARSVAALAVRGPKAIAALAPAASDSDQTRLNSVRAASRVDSPSARALVRSRLTDSKPTVRQSALHAVSLWRDREALSALIGLIRAKPSAESTARETHLQRVAAEALGRIGDPSAIPALFELASRAGTDRVLEHSAIYALIEIGDAKATEPGLASENVRTRRAAIVALDQMSKDALRPEQVGRWLASPDEGTRTIAAWVAGRHPEWAGALAGTLKDQLERVGRSTDVSDQNRLVEQLARFAREAPARSLLAETVRDPKRPADSRRVAILAMSRAGLKAVPTPWVEALAAALASADPDLTLEGVSAAKALAIPKDKAGGLTPVLLEIAANRGRPEPVRLDALLAVPGGVSPVAPKMFTFLRERLEPARPAATRTAAALILSRATLDPAQLVTLLDDVKTAGPLELDTLLTAFGTSADPGLGLKLVAALKAAGSRSALRVETLKPRLDKFGDAVKSAAAALYASINQDAPAQNARLESMLPTLKDGDIRRGQAVFNGPKVACISCHAVGYGGGHVGPDLSRIAEVRTDRDMLESLLYPSLSFVRSYEPLTIALRDGKVVNGIVKEDTEDELVLTLSANDVVRVPRTEIEAMKPGSVSVMPDGLDRQLNRQELADLLAFLRSRK